MRIESNASFSTQFKVFSLFLILIYSGVVDYIPPLGLIKPGLLCVVVLIVIWFSSSQMKGDMAETELKVLASIIVMTIISFAYAENIGVARWLLETEIIYFFGLAAGTMLALKSKQDLEVFLKLWVLLSICVSIQVVVNGGGGPSTLGDENDVSVVAVVMFPFAYYAFGHFSRLFSLLCVVAMISLLAAVVIAGSRGGFLGLVAMLGIIYLFSGKKLKLTVYALLAVSIAVALFVSEEYIEDMSSIQNTDEGTADERLYSWGLGVDMLLDNPVLGVGTGQYGWNVWMYQKESGDLNEGSDGHRPRKHLGGRSSHSTYIDYLSERGFVGLVLILSMINSLRLRLKDCRGKYKEQMQSQNKGILVMFPYALSSACVGYLVCSVFVTTFYFPTMWLLIGLIVAVHRISDRSSLLIDDKK